MNVSGYGHYNDSIKNITFKSNLCFQQIRKLNLSNYSEINISNSKVNQEMKK